MFYGMGFDPQYLSRFICVRDGSSSVAIKSVSKKKKLKK